MGTLADMSEAVLFKKLQVNSCKSQAKYNHCITCDLQLEAHDLYFIKIKIKNKQ